MPGDRLVIALCESWLKDAGVDDATIAGRRLAIEAIAQAFEAAKAAPWPDPAAAFADVQDLGVPGAAGGRG